eukprot:418500_1
MNLKMLKCIDKPFKEIVHGYVRDIFKSAPLKYDCIPVEIINIILLFYYNAYRKFDVDHCGGDLQIINDTILKKIAKSTKGYHSCVFGSELRATQICKQFHIKIKLKQPTTSLYMGFFTCAVNDKTIDYTDCLGRGINQTNSVGILINACFRYFKLSDKSNDYKVLQYIAPNNFGEGDTFMLSFDFVENELKIYHNGIQTKDTISIKDYEKITPAFSLRGMNSSIEILECEYVICS